MKRFIRVYGSGSGSVRHPDSGILHLPYQNFRPLPFYSIPRLAENVQNVRNQKVVEKAIFLQKMKIKIAKQLGTIPPDFRLRYDSVAPVCSASHRTQGCRNVRSARGGAAFLKGTFDTVRSVITIYIADILSSN